MSGRGRRIIVTVTGYLVMLGALIVNLIKDLKEDRYSTNTVITFTILTAIISGVFAYFLLKKFMPD